VIYLKHSFVWSCNLGTSKSRSENRNVLKCGAAENQWDRSCGKRRTMTQSQGGEEHPT